MRDGPEAGEVRADDRTLRLRYGLGALRGEVHLGAHRRRGEGQAASGPTRGPRGPVAGLGAGAGHARGGGTRAAVRAPRRPAQRRGELQAQGQGRSWMRHSGCRQSRVVEGHAIDLRLRPRGRARPRRRRHRFLQGDAGLLPEGRTVHRARGPSPLQQRRPRREARGLGGDVGVGRALREVQALDGCRVRHGGRDQGSSAACPGAHCHDRGLRCGIVHGAAAPRRALLPRQAPARAHGSCAQLAAAPLRPAGRGRQQGLDSRH
mmetsp:Transcript_12842/g.33330  ORF Transcript_12842/g.33330 Transcript_12842/m.33330 type:complete len:263 (-) Transcript_12842:552-1340(-)